MYKVAVLGERDSIFGFEALGIDTFPVSNEVEAVKALKTLANGNYAVIYITESVYSHIEQEISSYQTGCIPAIIPIPGVTGNTGIGIRNVKKTVEQAVGSDIIFNNDN